jgi:hypothetical protein
MLVGFEEVGVGHSESLCGRARFLSMNPRDYKTWTSFADHPIFSDRKHGVTAWSSDPSRYDDLKNYAVFNPDWYVHRDPRLSTDVQAACAARDIRNLAETCAALEQRFGKLDHELFVLDDLTVYVHVIAQSLMLDVYPQKLDDSGRILMLFVSSPVEADELGFDSVSDVVPKLESLIANGGAAWS